MAEHGPHLGVGEWVTRAGAGQVTKGVTCKASWELVLYPMGHWALLMCRR